MAAGRRGTFAEVRALDDVCGLLQRIFKCAAKRDARRDQESVCGRSVCRANGQNCLRPDLLGLSRQRCAGRAGPLACDRPVFSWQRRRRSISHHRVRNSWHTDAWVLSTADGGCVANRHVSAQFDRGQKCRQRRATTGELTFHS